VINIDRPTAWRTQSGDASNETLQWQSALSLSDDRLLQLVNQLISSFLSWPKTIRTKFGERSF